MNNKGETKAIYDKLIVTLSPCCDVPLLILGRNRPGRTRNIYTTPKAKKLVKNNYVLLF